MRIISGKYRGKKLREFKLETTKPTTDSVKESIFNLIQFDVSGAIVLDLFSGTGALGIEAISRGADKVFFVDKNKEAVQLITNNLKDIDGDYDVEHLDYMDFLKRTDKKFDIIFVDPPYKSDFAVKAIEYIVENNLLNSHGIIIFETSYDFDFNFSNKKYSCVRKKYGNTAVYKLQVQDEL